MKMDVFDDPRYKYIWIVVEIYCRSCDETGSYNNSYVPISFEKRYTEGLIDDSIPKDCTYRRYLQDEKIQSTLKNWELDKKAFWLLLLFVLDYTYTSCNDILKFDLTQREEVEKIIEGIKNMIDFDPRKGFSMVDSSAALTLKIKNKQNIVISSAETLFFVASTLEEGIERDMPWRFDFGKLGTQYSSEPNTMRIASFTKMLSSVWGKYGVEVNSGLSKMKFIAYLVYWSELSNNVNYIRTEKPERPLKTNENGKGYRLKEINGIKWIVSPFDAGKYLADQIKSYKNKSLNNFNKYYM